MITGLEEGKAEIPTSANKDCRAWGLMDEVPVAPSRELKGDRFGASGTICTAIYSLGGV